MNPSKEIAELGAIYKLHLTLTEDILGGVPKNKDLYGSYILSRAEKEGITLTPEQIEEELQTLQEMEEKGWTGFHMDEDGNPFLYDYVIKGFLKDACGMLRRAVGTRSKKLTAYKKVIDGLIFPLERRIPINLNGGKMGILERPLRASTPQGERVALARSDTCPAGSTLEFTLQVMGGASRPLVEEWFAYGRMRGLGQWRNASWGRFTYKLSLVKAEA